MNTRVGIIGAGMAGLACAAGLAAHGCEPVLFDKGRGPGGRMSTRRMATPLGDAAFDHGAQYFTVRDPGFARVVDDWEARGLAARWPAAGADAWVGVPGMNALVRDMADRFDTTFGREVRGFVREKGEWWLVTPEGVEGPFAAVIVAVPAEQAAGLLSLHDFEMARNALMARSQPCWTAMYAFDRPAGGGSDVLRDRGAVSWAARNSAKPGREGPEAWVVQAGGAWSQTHLERPAEEVAELLLAALVEATGQDLPEPVARAAHRWRYAMTTGTDHGSLWSDTLRLGACGDWLVGPRVECAWLSGTATAARTVAGLAAVPAAAAE